MSRRRWQRSLGGGKRAVFGPLWEWVDRTPFVRFGGQRRSDLSAMRREGGKHRYIQYGTFVPPSRCSRTVYVVSHKVNAYDIGAWWDGRITSSKATPTPEVHRLVGRDFQFNFPFLSLRNLLDWHRSVLVHPDPLRAYVIRLSLSCCY
ncbi:hypothetical protein TIFTF001_016528 [Ficus carica]|uniref:Uncharacterized protein n=1 Tax=Ficus carica TaxID=3494 RepID=A0AA88A7W6_FICCA|nr:hypothetical protein TIFTF001_016528 [Ficus carica]